MFLGHIPMKLAELEAAYMYIIKNVQMLIKKIKAWCYQIKKGPSKLKKYLAGKNVKNMQKISSWSCRHYPEDWISRKSEGQQNDHCTKNAKKHNSVKWIEIFWTLYLTWFSFGQFWLVNRKTIFLLKLNLPPILIEY